MEIYSIGFTQKSAGEFFGTLKTHGIERLLDVRLNNTSQLAGFAKQADLAYFLREICSCAYEHEPLLAPEQEMLDAYKKKKGNWDDYAEAFLQLMRSRKIQARRRRPLPAAIGLNHPAHCPCRRHPLDFQQHGAQTQRRSRTPGQRRARRRRRQL
jgi:hypothetical protein